jgi:Holliday junction resolvase RusA-like endonuclease
MYTDAQTASYENLVKLAWKAEAGDMPPLTGPVSVLIWAYFAIPKSTPRKNIAGMVLGYIQPVKRPDIDNLSKCVLDGLNGVAFVDDAQVVHLEAAKFYSDTPRLVVLIRQYAI